MSVKGDKNLFQFIRDRRVSRRLVSGLYQMAMTQARTEKPYTQWQVPDTVTGRINMMSLFVVIIMYHISRSAEQQAQYERVAKKVNQKLYNLMEQDFEAALRRMGVGDDGVVHRIRKASSSFYGDYFALVAVFKQEKQQESSGDSFQEVIRRNIYAAYFEEECQENLQKETVADLCQWVWAYHQSLSGLAYEQLCQMALDASPTLYKP